MCLPQASRAAELQPRTVRAFDDYIRGVEARAQARLKGPAFLWTDDSAERRRQARSGQVPAECLTGDKPMSVPGGLIHDWIGAVFIPGTTLDKTMAMVQDYNHHKNVYQPEVLDSRLLSRQDDDYKVYLRLLKKKVITVVLDTEYDVHYFTLDRTRRYSRSYSTKIAEVQNAGKRDERELPAGNDHGFLWRLDSYWRFEEREGGVYVECEAVSLTRDIPPGLGWLIQPIIRDLPKESLINTLAKTRAVLQKPGG